TKLTAERDLWKLKFDAKDKYVESFSKELYSLRSSNSSYLDQFISYSNEVSVLKLENVALNAGLNNHSNKAALAILQLENQKKVVRPAPSIGLQVVVPQVVASSKDSKKDSSLEDKLNISQKESNVPVQAGNSQLADSTIKQLEQTTHYNPHKKFRYGGSFSQKQAEVNIKDFRKNFTKSLTIVDGGPIPLATTMHSSNKKNIFSVIGVALGRPQEYVQYAENKDSTNSGQNLKNAGRDLKKSGKSAGSLSTLVYTGNSHDEITENNFNYKKLGQEFGEGWKDLFVEVGGPFAKKHYFEGIRHPITGVLKWPLGIFASVPRAIVRTVNPFLGGKLDNVVYPIKGIHDGVVDTVVADIPQAILNAPRVIFKPLPDKIEKGANALWSVPAVTVPRWAANSLKGHGVSNGRNIVKSAEKKSDFGVWAETSSIYLIPKIVKDLNHDNGEVGGGGHGGEGGGNVGGGGHGGEGGL
ncbi:MAG: hypothetical protein AABX85_04190, partial [Nanoarchaeota archaeon]